MRSANGTRVLTVMYHYVRDRAGTDDAGIRGLDAPAFCRQLDLLYSQLDPITWPRFRAWRNGQALLPDPCLLLTFDDGLADHAEVVAPILESRGLRGLFFVPGRVLAGGWLDPAHQVHLLQARLGDERFAEAVQAWLRQHAADECGPHAIDEAAAQRVYHYETPERARIKYLLTYALPLLVRARLVDDLCCRHVGEPAELARQWYLSADQVRALDAAGHTVGGHGMFHLPLLRLAPMEQELELRRSAAALDDLLGPGPRPFSYPLGSVDAGVARRCAAAGFVHAFTTCPEWIGRGADDHLLGRADTIEVEELLARSELCAV